MKKVLCLTSALVCCTAALASCNVKFKVTKDYDSDGKASKKSASDYVGKWECSEIEMDGEKSDNLWGADVNTLFQIELAENNKGTFFSFLTTLVQPEPFDLTWEDSGNDEIIMNIDQADSDEPLTMKYSNGRMIMDQSDEYSNFIAYLDKVDEFTPVSDDTEMSFGFSSDSGASISFSDAADDMELETEPATKKHLNIY
jgi:predicted small secreted protein